MTRGIKRYEIAKELGVYLQLLVIERSSLVS